MKLEESSFVRKITLRRFDSSKVEDFDSSKVEPEKKPEKEQFATLDPPSSVKNLKPRASVLSIQKSLVSSFGDEDKNIAAFQP